LGIDPQVARALLSFWKPQKIWVHVDVGAAARANPNVTRESMVLTLNRLEQAAALEVVPSQVENVYHILRRPTDLRKLAQTEYERLQARERQELGRIEQVLSFIASDDCHAKLLTEYFEGSNGPSTSNSHEPVFPCGECPYCQLQAPIQLPEKAADAIDSGLWAKLVSEVRLPKDDPKLIVRFALGHKSPRITQLKLDKMGTFGILEGRTSYETIMQQTMRQFFP
jgi:ATP-dependent DNA helicase RecQ